MKDVLGLVGLKTKVRQKYSGSQGGVSLKWSATGTSEIKLGFNGRQTREMALQTAPHSHPKALRFSGVADGLREAGPQGHMAQGGPMRRGRGCGGMGTVPPRGAGGDGGRCSGAAARLFA